MFYKLIVKKRDEWLNSPNCTIRELLDYIINKGRMRDAQIEAIKTYLFLKIFCKNKPLSKLFIEGTFNSLNLDDESLTLTAREVLSKNKAGIALLEYSKLKDEKGEQIAPSLEKFIKQNSNDIDFETVFKKIFYDVTYADYLFSLPMGAGKTFLMAAFIYLDLYFAENEPDNPVFAHNFIVLVPSGLKQSIIPSLKDIQNFDPTWIISEPAASRLKRLIKFEFLEENKSANKSNKIKNPNAQKINNHQPLDDLMGLVAITNAEKVILDRLDKEENENLFSEDENKKIKIANELRHIIGKLPNLAIYIDEVHHASDAEIKLRQVVNEWTKGKTFNSVLGFSGTPYLNKAEDVMIGKSFSIKNKDLSNVVYYYPLIDAIGNFLKTPTVKYADLNTEQIVRSGVSDFLDLYKDTVYPDGTCAKMAIYCGQINTLEEQIYPLVSQIISNYGFDPTLTLLKYHRGNINYPQPQNSEIEYASLDTSLSKVKIILLVQIGKEGWNCKSLTGVILPQKGVCPTNMVLQTSCRCLREVKKGAKETALIWLNDLNANTLNKQLKQQQNISLQEFSNKERGKIKTIVRYSRMKRMNLPPIKFYQLKISYIIKDIVETLNTSAILKDDILLRKIDHAMVYEQDLQGHITNIEQIKNTDKEKASFNQWLHLIVKESFNTLPIVNLRKYIHELKDIFDKITVKKGGEYYFVHQYDHQLIRSLIRQAFIPKRDLIVKEEIIPTHANLLQIEKLTSPIEVSDDSLFFPAQKDVQEILTLDRNEEQGYKFSLEIEAKIKELASLGFDTSSLSIKDNHPECKKTYHYLPYHFDSKFEEQYFINSLTSIIKNKNLEYYFNGDDTLTEFKIDCYKQVGRVWKYIGKYVPDFLVIQRTPDKIIHKVLIIETKGKGFARNFEEKRSFMENTFIQKNREKFGYQRFKFLYLLEEEKTQDPINDKTITEIKSFFNE